MRIAVITLPLKVNFGGVLQCYALQQVLSSMGHEVSVLQQGVPFMVRVRLFFTRWIKTYILRKESEYYGAKTDAEIVGRNFQAFIRKHIHILHFQDWASIRERDFDAFVVGSDQVWRKKYNNQIQHAYLDFVKEWKGIKRVAYAASFGTDYLEYSHSEIEECAKLVRLFDAVSTREMFGVEMCRNKFQINATCCIDPTLLLSGEDYLNLLEGVEVPFHENGLLYYFIDASKEKEDFAYQISVNKHLNCFNVNNSNLWMRNKTFEERIQLPIEHWIAGFRDAKFVVTDSFHGCVFSILFNKPFFVIGNVERGMSRFKSLLSIFHLEDRLISLTTLEQYNDKPIQWNKVNKILKEERGKSLNFLSVNLNK